ncbi:MAG: DUF4080 domain-containing protein [Clostridia bacterium]
MKTLFLSINSQYIHTLLAPRYLVSNSEELVEILETNVNINLDKLIEEIVIKKPDVIAISCYIFNIKFVRILLPILKEKLPDCKIIMGGYEVAFDEDRYLNMVDYIIKGEGDFVFGQLLTSIKLGDKKFDKIIEVGTVKNLDDIITPYTKEYSLLGKTKILYMETTRGCPFHCSYCMSANTNGVRSFSLERVISDLDILMSENPKQIKMVDRTFNYNIKRATEIFRYIIDKFGSSGTNFHFEMAPELFNDEMLDVVKSAPMGLFQFEIGVQSYNKDTLKAVCRVANLDRIDYNLKNLVEMGNMHIHTDLIAGLPFESLESFKKGFDRLFLIFTDCVQLGFLKILKGSVIYDERSDFVINDKPPYQVISNDYITKEEMEELMQMEQMLGLYYNSRRFVDTMRLLIPKYFPPYQFFYEISKYFEENNLTKRGMSAYYQCEHLYNFVRKSLGDNLDDNLLMNTINNDYRNSGNTRKWRRHLD